MAEIFLKVWGNRLFQSTDSSLQSRGVTSHKILFYWVTFQWKGISTI